MSVRCLIAGAAMFAGLAAVGASAQTQTTTQAPIVYGLPTGQYYLVPADRVDSATAYRPGSAPFDLSRGVWGVQPVTPPAGFALVEQGELIGDAVYDGSGTSFGTIRRLLVDPATGLAHYAIVSTPEVSGAYIIVPISAIQLSNMSIDMAARDIRLLPTYGMADLERRYPPSAMSTAAIVGPVVMVPASTAGLTPRTGTTAGTSTSPYRMVQSGDWIGRSVVDSAGQMIGAVDYLLLDPATGAPQQAAVTVGRGDYMLIPVANLRLQTGRLVAEQSAGALLSAPRLQQAELIQRYGPVPASR